MQFKGIFGYTTSRLIVLMFVSQIALTFGILYFVLGASDKALVSEEQAFVAELHDNLLVQYRSDGLSSLAFEIEKRLSLGNNHNEVILLTLADGEPVAGNLAAWPTVRQEVTGWTERDLYRKNSDEPEAIGLTTTILPGGAHLLTGRVLTGNERLLRINFEAMIAAALLAIPIALLIAIALAKLLARRIRIVSSVTQAVRKGDLSQRIPLDGTDGTFDQLSEDINAMLGQLETVISQLRMMTDGLAHDLRSPITRLKSVIEHAVISTNDEAALAALHKVSQEAETLLAMLSTALQISRAEAGMGRDRFGAADVGGLLADLVEIYGPLAEDRGITLNCEAPAGLVAPLHRELISQALGNLIENGLKYADGADRIEMTAKQVAGTIQLAVADNGVGIPTELRGEAMRRFGRLDVSRKGAGAGLGLSLVAAVAKLHGGGVELEDNGPGLMAVIILDERKSPAF